jgi:membrane protein required for colicin V production
MVLNLAGVDIAILSIIGVSVITGLYRGFVRELLALGIWIFSFWGAAHYSKQAAIYLKPYVTQDTLRMVLAFVGVMFAILIVGSLITALIGLLLKRSGLSGTDRLLGMVFGWVRGAFIITLIIVVAKISGFPEKEYADSSKFYHAFNPAVQWMSGYVPKILAQLQNISPDAASVAMIPEINTEDIIQQSPTAVKVELPKADVKAALPTTDLSSSIATEQTKKFEVQGIESLEKPADGVHIQESFE